MKSAAPTLLVAMLCGIFQAAFVALIIAAFVKQEGGFFILGMFAFIASMLLWAKSYEEADELRKWIDPDLKQELLQTIPQDAIDRQWIKEIEKAYNTYISDYAIDNPLWLANQQIAKSNKDSTIRQLISSAKAAKGVRLPKPVTIRSND